MNAAAGGGHRADKLSPTLRLADAPKYYKSQAIGHNLCSCQSIDALILVSEVVDYNLDMKRSAVTTLL